MNDQDSDLAMNAIARAADAWQQAAYIAENYWHDMNKPSIKLRPSVYPDGDQWCVLYGENLQHGVCAFGDTPEKAMQAFDAEWLNGKAKKVMA